MGLYLSRSIMILLLLSFWGSAFALTPDQTAALKVIRDYKLFLNSGNAALLDRLTICASSFGTKKTIPKFLLKTKAATGKDLSEEYTCRELLEKYFGFQESEPFEHRKSFRLMQYYAILAQSGSLNSNDAEETESIDGNSQKQLSNFEHPVRGTLDRIWGQIANMPRPADVVWVKAREAYLKSIGDNCREFLVKGKAVIDLQLKAHRSKPFMKNLCGVLTKKTNDGLGFTESWAVGIVRNSFWKFSIKQRKIWRMKYQQLYYEQISQAPQYLLFDSIYPSRAQIISVISKMKKFQRDALSELTAMKGDTLLKLAPLIDVSPMTIAALVGGKERWSDAHTQEVLQSITKLHHSRESKKAVIQGAVMLGAAAGCYVLPWGRLRMFLRSACLFTLGLPLDLYFLYDASLLRMKTVQEFSMTPELEYVLSKSERISEANRDVIFNLIFLPLDIPVVKILSTIKKLK